VQQAAPGSNTSTFRGALSFANDTNNPFDSTFGFSNAALGIFSSFQQASGVAEGRNGFRNIEAYAQDTWRIRRVTLDYGVRLIHEQPQHDEANVITNFLTDKWNAASAPLLYAAGCANGVYPCAGDARQAMDPRTGALLGTGSSWRIGSVVPNTGNLLNGVLTAGSGINKTGVDSPLLKAAPRFGFAYDVTGRQTLVLRGGVGLFFARGFLNATAANPPFVQDVTVRYNQLQALTSTALPIVPPQLAANEYLMPYPADTQWSSGMQMALPFATSLDVAYVGHHSWDEINNVNINAIDFGTAYLGSYQDRTLAASTTPGAQAVSVAEMVPYRGFGTVNMTISNGWRTYHSLQLAINRRFTRGLQLGFVDTISLYDRSQTAPRFQHDGSGAVTFRADQADQDKLLGNLRPVTHIMKGSFLWDLPDVGGGAGAGTRTIGAIVNNWQLSGIWSASTGSDYTVGYTYANNGTNTNLTGSPDYAARIRIVGDPGSGCSNDPLRQFTASGFAGPQPGSVGLESGNGYLRGCFQSALDLSIARRIPLAGTKAVQLRVDIFNAPNQAIVTGRNTTMNLASPAGAAAATNLPFDASGNVIAARARPNGAGFGVANAYQAPRSVQLQLRFEF
jgi:hypothetical protein